MDSQMLSQLGWFILGEGSLRPFATLVCAAIVATRVLGAGRTPLFSDAVADSGVGAWLRSRDWNALVHCAATGGITAATLYCVNRIVARVAARSS
jgi:hypothetical protein